MEIKTQIDRDLELQKVFQGFCGGERKMGNSQFLKLVKDCNFVDKKLSATEADIIFTKVRGKREGKIDFAEFQHALETLASKKEMTKIDIIDQVIKTGAPHFHGTKVIEMKFHDKKSTDVHPQKDRVIQ